MTEVSMTTTPVTHLLTAALLLAVAPLGAQQPSPADAPPPATAADTVPDSATIAAGQRIYQGRGLCATCHGLQGEGLLGPATRLNAGKAKWLHHDGSWAGIIALVSRGVDAADSESGQAMPPRGGARLTDEQIRQVAAYVWKLHRTAPPE